MAQRKKQIFINIPLLSEAAPRAPLSGQKTIPHSRRYSRHPDLQREDQFSSSPLTCSNQWRHGRREDLSSGQGARSWTRCRASRRQGQDLATTLIIARPWKDTGPGTPEVEDEEPGWIEALVISMPIFPKEKS